MSHKKGFDLFEMGANLGSGWQEVGDTKKSSVSLLTKSEHTLVLQFEKRKGKAVTLVGKFYFDPSEMKALHKKVKQKLACGGSIEAEFLLFQGDHRTTIKSLFIQQGWKFK